MELSARKRGILRRVIDHYVRDIHPVSSQVIAEDVRVSSATVRNELVSLEELGFLRQPHTSGGRVPTDLAYRFLVEELVNQLADTIGQRARVDQVYRLLSHEVESLIEGTLDLLTEMTGYVAWVSMPVPSVLDIKSVSFVEADSRELLIVLVTGAGAMQSKRIQVDMPVKDLALGQLADALNSYLRNRNVIDVDFQELNRIFLERVAVPDSILGALQDFFTSMADSRERVVFGNALRLALQPEFLHADSLRDVLGVIEDRDRFVRMLRQQLRDREVQTIIGTENTEPNLHDCSLVLARYAMPEAGEGTVGVLGPTRLLYARTLPWVKVIGEAVAETLREFASGEDEG
jgi:heat-inducible transcriptional repressor